MVGEAGIEPAACGARIRRAANCATPQIRNGAMARRAVVAGTLIADVIVPLAPVEASGAQAAFFETAVLSHMGTGRCARASRSVVAVHDAVAAPHLRFRGITPASAYARSRKDGSLSKSS